MEIKLDKEFHKQNLERFMNSSEYTQLERQLSVNNARFREFSPKLQRSCLYFFKLGLEEYMPDLWRIFYKRRVPTINEFLTKEFIKDDATTLFPVWRKELIETFMPGSAYYELVVGGAIGTGKTTFTNLGHAYNLIRLTSLRNPHATMGSSSATYLALALFSITVEKSIKAVLDPFMSLLDNTPLFEKVRFEREFQDFGDDVTPYYTRDSTVYFPNNIIINVGATLGHSISFSLFGASFDEAEFRIGGAGDAMRVYENLKERVDSRFMGSRFVFLTMMSSAKYTTGVVSKYTERIKKDDPHTKVLGYPIWEVRDFDSYSKGNFYVLRGTQTHPSRILDVYREEIDAGSYTPPPRCEVIKVPESYRNRFESDINSALRNLAGVQTLGADQPFDDLEHIEHSFLLGEIEFTAPLEERDSLLDQLPSDMFIRTPEGRRLARYPNAPRYMHLDLAETAEAGISMVHKEYRINSSGEKDTIYVTDFMGHIVSPDRIKISSVLKLIFDLHDLVEVNFAMVSADQYQSASLRQEITIKQIINNPMKTGKGRHESIRVSVDINDIQYRQLSNVVSMNLLATGVCPKLKNQLLDIQIDEKRKVFTTTRKDVADSLCGSVHNALMNPKDEPVYEFKDLKEITNSTIETPDDLKWEEV